MQYRLRFQPEVEPSAVRDSYGNYKEAMRLFDSLR